MVEDRQLPVVPRLRSVSIALSDLTLPFLRVLPGPVATNELRFEFGGETAVACLAVNCEDVRRFAERLVELCDQQEGAR